MAGVSSKYATKRKITDENRSFQEKWEEEFCFINGHKEGTAICLICRETVVGIKRYNLFRHYTSKHSSFTEAYPLETIERKNKIIHLKSSIHRQQNLMTTAVGQNEAITKASYQVCNILAKRMKPFTDAELMKECMITVSQTLFQKFSNSKQIMAQVNKLTLSESTCRRRVEDISKNLFEAVIDKLKILQSCLRFQYGYNFYVSMLIICSVLHNGRNHRRRLLSSDYHEGSYEFVEKHGIPVNKLISVCTDGCPSMVGAIMV